MDNIVKVLPEVMVSSTGGHTALFESANDGITGGKRKRNRKTARKRRKGKGKGKRKSQRNIQSKSVTDIKSFFY